MADFIDRGKAIKAIEDLQDCYNGFSDTYDKACIIGVLQELPSAERRGKWIEREVVTDSNGIEEHQVAKCSACGRYHTIPYLYSFKGDAYCPNCGAKMEE